MPNGNFTFPTRYRIGAGRRSELGKECKLLGIEKPLIVTDPGVAGTGWFKELAGDHHVFQDVRSNPDALSVENAKRVYQEGGHDGVIAVGGGSPTDVAKCLAVMAGHDGHPFDYEYAGGKWKSIQPEKVAPLVVLPTTAGTGSECSNGAVITDTEARIKRTFAHPGTVFFPRTVIADPETTIGLPAHVTAATGMDALTHCFEAYIAPTYHPMADGIALEGMRLLAAHLPTCLRSPNDIEARTQVLMASSMAAVAFQKGLGLVHAMVHPLGAMTDIHHGLGNGILLPYVMEHLKDTIAPRMELLGRYLGVDASFDGVRKWVLGLREELAIPHTLPDHSDIVNELAEKTMQEKLYLATCPAKVTASEVSDLFRRALGTRSPSQPLVN